MIHLTKREFKAINAVVRYLEHEEFQHFSEYDKKPKDHIYYDVKALKRLADLFDKGVASYK
jgi:hypothetical protein